MADIISAPLASFESAFSAGVAGLTGTVKLGIYDGLGNVTSALASTGIVETPAGSGIYVGTRTAPAGGGQYVLVWSLDGTTDPDQVFVDQLIVTADPTVARPAASLYVTENEVKAAAQLLGETFADGDLDIIRPAVCRAIDAYKRTTFYPHNGIRYYTPRQGVTSLSIYDLNAVLSVKVDRDDDGVYEETLTLNSDYWLAPENNGADGRPWNRIVTKQVLPSTRNSVKITGSWGWAETPSQVTLAAQKLCIRELHQLRSAPLGIVIASDVAARIGSVYRDIAYLLDTLNPRPQVASLQVG